MPQFISDCLMRLRQNISPYAPLSNGQSLLDRIFQYLGERRFDNHLELLLPLMQSLREKGTDFRRKITQGESGITGIDLTHLTCRQVALVCYDKLLRENHINKDNAARILEVVTGPLEIDDCLFMGYLESITTFLQNTRPCFIDKPEGQYIMQQLFIKLTYGCYDEILHSRPEVLPDLVLTLLQCGADPNVQTAEITILGKGRYKNPTCLHVAYLYWQSLKAQNNSTKAKSLKRVFFHLLRDPRADVRVRFTELGLPKRHFSNPFNFLHGEYIEGGNLAHYALIDGDFSTCRKVLALANDLVGSTCSTVTAPKWLQNAAQRNPETALPLKPSKNSCSFDWWPDEEGLKYQSISLCHIAARRLDIVACTFLTATGGNNGISNTAFQHMIEYAKLYKEDFAHHDRQTKINARAKVVFNALKTAQPLPSTLPQAFYVFHQEGYDVLYHPGTKCPIVRHVLHAGALTRNVDSSKYQGYRQYPLIPKLNRAAVKDLNILGAVHGHAKPRADSLVSDQALYDAGYMINIIAQDETLNNGLWKKLETLIRDSAKQHICLHVYTGGVFTSQIDVKGPKVVAFRIIGSNEVHVPTHLFKVVYTFDYGFGWRPSAFLIPNIPLTYHTDLTPYCVSVERIQELTGVDFLGKYKI